MVRRSILYSAMGMVLLLALGTGDAIAGKAGKWAGVGAGIGGIVGLVGGDLGDAVVGAAVGAAGGAVAGSISDSNDQKRAAEERQRQQAEAEAQAASAAKAAKAEEDQIIAVIGKDNYESYKALRDCEHQRASALAQAGATSENKDHQLASVWLEALIALDQKDSAGAEKQFQELANRDGDVDTPQQASIEADRVLLEMRQERRDMGLAPCGS